jgi:hypothetical protein
MEKALIELPWRSVRDGVDVKLVEQEQEFASSLFAVGSGLTLGWVVAERPSLCLTEDHPSVPACGADRQPRAVAVKGGRRPSPHAATCP